jgi:EAL domain-containing protein (putative c-di-GMP-specific phosphodiesterase class I)
VTARLIDRLALGRDLRPVFQPIFRLDEGEPTVVACEGLIRGSEGSNFFRPDVLFEYARRLHEEHRADWAAIEAILREAAPLPTHLRIHFNVHAATIARDLNLAAKVVEKARHYGIEPGRLVAEIIEHWSTTVKLADLDKGLRNFREQGIAVALDDVGAGVANLGLILFASPSYLKIDGSLVEGVAEDPRKEAALRCLNAFALQLGAETIVEAPATHADLEVTARIGIRYAQGFILGKPQTAKQLLSDARFATSSPSSSQPAEGSLLSLELQ